MSDNHRDFLCYVMRFLELACLITEQHTIPIDYLFHDWEDNNGSHQKTFDSVKDIIHN